MSKNEFQLFVKGIGGKTIIVRIDGGATIKELFEKVADILSLPGEFGLVYGPKELRPNDPNGKIMRLKDYAIEDESAIFATLRLPGGAKTYGLDIKLTEDLDCISLTDDEPRTKLPCGHAIGPQSMTDYLMFKIGEKQHIITCPVAQQDKPNPKCKEEIKFKTAKRVAALTKQERNEVEGGLAENYMLYQLRAKQCPGCDSYCTRQNCNSTRVKCTYCSLKRKNNYEFCWKCLRIWKGSSDCGNPACNDSSLSVLAQCKTKIMPNGVECPEARACPFCGTLIVHLDRCKHMQCDMCKNFFCFICLSKRGPDGTYSSSCGSYSSVCKAAPRQTVMPN